MDELAEGTKRKEEGGRWWIKEDIKANEEKTQRQENMGKRKWQDRFKIETGSGGCLLLLELWADS